MKSTVRTITALLFCLAASTTAWGAEVGVDTRYGRITWDTDAAAPSVRWNGNSLTGGIAAPVAQVEKVSMADGREAVVLRTGGSCSETQVLVLEFGRRYTWLPPLYSCEAPVRIAAGAKGGLVIRQDGEESLWWKGHRQQVAMIPTLVQFAGILPDNDHRDGWSELALFGRKALPSDILVASR